MKMRIKFKTDSDDLVTLTAIGYDTLSDEKAKEIAERHGHSPDEVKVE